MVVALDFYPKKIPNLRLNIIYKTTQKCDKGNQYLSQIGDPHIAVIIMQTEVKDTTKTNSTLHNAITDCYSRQQDNRLLVVTHTGIGHNRQVDRQVDR